MPPKFYRLRWSRWLAHDAPDRGAHATGGARPALARRMGAHCPFLSRLSVGQTAQSKRPRRQPKRSGDSSNLFSGPRSSVPCGRFDACRAKGVPSMCDYSLDLDASRPAKVGDELVTTMFPNSMTRGFGAIGEPNVAVCLYLGAAV